MAEVVAAVGPDILLLTAVDWDAGLLALSALAGRLREAGADYPHLFALRPNTGLASGLDLDGDGRLGGPGDAQGFGYFAGQGGMALLSRLPIDAVGVRDFSALLWRDLPGAEGPRTGEGPFPSEAAWNAQRLSTTGHWDVPVRLPSGDVLRLLAWHATPPAFDGPEDRNGLRNRDEAALWLAYLDGALGGEPPARGHVLLGDANLDPVDGDGRTDALQALLSRSDPRPRSDGAAAAALLQGGMNERHAGDPGLDTADWDDARTGNMRVDYVLPSADLTVLDAGVVWPLPDDPLAAAVEAASRHRLVWVDVALP